VAAVRSEKMGLEVKRPEQVASGVGEMHDNRSSNTF
jgi:hypothetical protein